MTDQAYTGGVGDEFKGLGPVTNLNNQMRESSTSAETDVQPTRILGQLQDKLPVLGVDVGYLEAILMGVQPTRIRDPQALFAVKRRLWVAGRGEPRRLDRRQAVRLPPDDHHGV